METFWGRFSCDDALLFLQFSQSCPPDIKLQAFSMRILASSDLSKVTSCMQHALSARYPRTRYAAGWDAKFLWIPLSYLPSCVADVLMTFLTPSLKNVVPENS